MKIDSRLALIALAVLLPARAGEPRPTPTPTARPALSRPRSTPAAGNGSSLADTVKRTRASATPVPKKRSLGVITNETLKKPPEGSGKGSVQVGPAHPIGAAPTNIAAPEGPSEAEWRSRANEARSRVENAESEVKRLELETKRLENDFYAWSDGNYRDRVIKPSWDQAREELKKARAELDAARNAQSDLEDDARKAGVPPGWLRETPR